ncbi:MAG: TVP38/TMEM64 family protein [Anaerolineaceae bacterium]|nr:TVP38/TMEM64 family protein [Anaerolineaceae bacterium]
MKSRWIWFLIGIVLVGLLVIIWMSPIGSLFRDQEQLSVWLQGWGRWAPLVTITLHVLQVLTAPIPGTAIDAVNGLLFGPWLGTLYSMTGLMIGSILVMVLTRRFGRPMMERFIDPSSIERIDRLVERRGSLVIFLIFLFPFLPDDAVCFLAGLTSIPLLELVLLAMAGRTPGVFVANLLGSHADSLVLWQWIVLGVLFALAAGFIWRFRSEIQEKILGWLEKISRKE